MGQRHNRRRNRPRLIDNNLRPPNGYQAWQPLRVSPLQFADPSSSRSPGSAALQSRRWTILQRSARAPPHDWCNAKDPKRMFGGDEEDGMELCDEMIQVVVGLFGDTDYIDP
jgi:hypothetical protein